MSGAFHIIRSDRIRKGLDGMQDIVRLALQRVESTWLPQNEYLRQVATGDLIDYEALCFTMGDRTFAKNYPEHPMSSINRFERIAAADCIRDKAAERLTPLPKEFLVKIRYLLFDCCSSVRHSLAAALYHAGDHGSVKALEKWASNERSSALVRDTAAVAALRCCQRGLDCKSVPLDVPAVSLVSSDITLAIQLNRLAKQIGFTLQFPEPEISDLFVFPANVRIVNRRSLGKTAWRYYIEYLEEGLRPIGENEKVAMLQDGFADEDLAIIPEPPLILTDRFSEADEAAWGLLPEVGMEVYRAEEWMHDWILAKVTELIQP